jgi:hypothetical protein
MKYGTQQAMSHHSLIMSISQPEPNDVDKFDASRHQRSGDVFQKVFVMGELNFVQWFILVG